MLIVAGSNTVFTCVTILKINALVHGVNFTQVLVNSNLLAASDSVPDYAILKIFLGEHAPRPP